MDYAVFGNGERNMVIIPGVSVTPVVPTAEAVEEAYSCFSDRYRVYLFDRRSEFPDRYTVRQMAEDTVTVMDGLGISDAYIMGVSQGGMIAQCIAVRHPDTVKKLVLTSTHSRPTPLAASVLGEWAVLAEKGLKRELNLAIFKGIYSESFFEKYRDVFMTMLDNGTPEQLKKAAVMLRACLTFDIYSDLDKIKCPVLVVADEDDKVLSVQASVEIADKLGCELYLYRGYGHAVYDQALDYKQRLADFFG